MFNLRRHHGGYFTPMKRLIASLFAATLLVGFVCSSRAESAVAPKSIVHVVTVSWKPGTTSEQIQAALDGVHRLASEYKGITHVWTKTLKAQGERKNAIVMEFASEQAFKDYTDSAAQKEWYKVYLPIRERSTTFDVTND